MSNIFDHADLSGGSESCWIWKGSLNKDGYAMGCGYGNGAHRKAYSATKGPIPKGLQIDHLCRNRACINPAHLEAVPQKVNLLRGEGVCAKNARKTHCKRGHEFTVENTLIYNSPSWGTLRVCKTCEKLRKKNLTREQKDRKNAWKRMNTKRLSLLRRKGATD